jgi:Nucleotidyltransferase substrate binding protein like.
MKIDTHFYLRCILTLEQAYSLLAEKKAESIEHEIYRSAAVKEFEIILEQSGKLLRKALKPFFHSTKAVDQLTFKDLFRHAATHSLITLTEAERWLEYRDNRNNTAHDYGVDFANKTLVILPQFIIDAKALQVVINGSNND